MRREGYLFPVPGVGGRGMNGRTVLTADFVRVASVGDVPQGEMPVGALDIGLYRDDIPAMELRPQISSVGLI